MERLEDYAAAAQLGRAYARGGYSNCDGFLLSLPTRSPEDTIFWEERPDEGVLFLVEQDRCFELFAVGRFTGPIALPALDKPVLFTHVRGEMPELAGFDFFRRCVRMEMRAESALAAPAELAVPGEEQEIRQLLLASLPEIDLPGEASLREAVRKGEIFCIRKDGRIAACVSGVITGKRCLISSVAVGSDMRRKGLGRKVVLGSIAAAMAKGAAYFSLWVETENLPAVRLYERCGFQKSNHSTQQWIKN